MSRRYLTLDEASSALNTGKEIEAFLGGFKQARHGCIRWLSLSKNGERVQGQVWEALDQGSEDFVDIYSFSPASGEWNMPSKTVMGDSIEEVLSACSISGAKLVNSGVVQDEYESYGTQAT